MFRKISVSALCVFFWLATIAFCSDDRWIDLKQACNRCYGGFNLDLEFAVGVKESTQVGAAGAAEPYGQVGIKVPFFSKEQRVKLSDAKRKFLVDGAGLIAVIEEQEVQIAILKEYMALTGKMAGEEGAAVLESIIKIRQDIAKAQAKRNEALRSFEAYCTCGNK